MSDFIFEIGYEEFPASFILPFVSQLKEKILADLEKQRITVENCREFSTCSRTALVCTGLPEKQPDIREKVTGAPKKVALNADGTLSKAGEAFLAKNKITEYFFEESEKGEVIAGYVEEKGKELAEVIAPIVKAALHAANFKKSMRWADNSFAFARPIRWIMLSIDGKPVEDDFEGIKFSTTSFGHRFLSNGALQVNAQNYCETLEAHYIFADRAKRRDYIKSEVLNKAAELGLTANIDENLLDEVTDMVEYPHVVIGNIPEKYKNLPVELVVKVLKKDQRYFTLCDKNSQVVKFASVLNNIPRDDSVVVEGNEKVVSARLSDAAFYFNDDLAKDFAALSERLKGVLFQKDLGTYSDKVERICKIASFIADKYFMSITGKQQTDFLYFLSSSFFIRFGNTPEFKAIVPEATMEEIKEKPYKYIHKEILNYLRSKLPQGSDVRLYPFTIKKNAGVYGIFFGASHIRAADKFLRLAWRINELNGAANFDIDDDAQKDQLELWGPQPIKKVDAFKRDLREKILNGEIKNNREAFDFTMNCGHIGSHAKEEIADMKRKGLITYEGSGPKVNYEAAYQRNEIVEYKIELKR